MSKLIAFLVAAPLHLGAGGSPPVIAKVGRAAEALDGSRGAPVFADSGK